MASHANAMAQQLQAGIRQSKNARLAWQAESNEVFAILDKAKVDQLQQQGAVFYQWNPPHAEQDLLKQHEVLIRLVTSFATEATDITQFIELLN